MKVAFIISVVLLIAALLGGYYLFDQNKKAKVEMENLQNAQKDLTFENEKLKQEKADIKAELEKKIADFSKEKEEAIAKVKVTFDTLMADMKEEIEDGKIKITQMADRLSVSMVDKILFPSGRAEITNEGVKVLDRVGKILKKTQDKIVRVEGHTDNVPISKRLEKQFPSNWELSTARATNVVRFLEETVGIGPERLEAVGMSQYHPVASNETVKGRSQNRRIEIVLLPELKKK